MSFLRTLLFVLLLPALLLPEGAKVCLHFLLCTHEATSGCCKVATAEPASPHQSCCSNLDTREGQPNAERLRIAAEQVDCCVKVPATPIAGATLRSETGGASDAARLLADSNTYGAAPASLLCVDESPWLVDLPSSSWISRLAHAAPPRPPPSLRFAVPLHL